jgi:hypothetical protein
MLACCLPGRWGMSRFVNLAFFLLAIAGCGSDQSDGTAKDAGACTWPASVTPVSDASTVGCWAQASFNICEVPNGGSVNAQDGTILGPDGKPVANACHDVCSASEYALTCTGATMSPSTIPSPDSSLGCKVIPGPTPSNELAYCCPCR